MDAREERPKIVVQQPTLLPWEMQWAKFMLADKYIVYAGVKFDKSDFQHRVKVDGQWLTLPVTGSRNDLIKDVKLADVSLAPLAERIRQTYCSKKNLFGDRLAPIVSYLERTQGGFLLDCTVDLLLLMAGIMGLPVPAGKFVIDENPRAGLGKVEKLEACILEHTGKMGLVNYFGGMAAKAYMGFDSFSVNSNVTDTYFQIPLTPLSGDSAMRIVAREGDPLKLIRECSEFMNYHKEIVRVPDVV